MKEEISTAQGILLGVLGGAAMWIALAVVIASIRL